MRSGSIVLSVAMVLVALVTMPRVFARKAESPETVMVTLHVKPGAEPDGARVLARHWETARRLNLVQESPHLTLRVSGPANKASFVEIFTWRDSSIPDAAPPEIRAIWDDMNKIADPRGGRPGLEIAMVEIVGQ